MCLPVHCTNLDKKPTHYRKIHVHREKRCRYFTGSNTPFFTHVTPPTPFLSDSCPLGSIKRFTFRSDITAFSKRCNEQEQSIQMIAQYICTAMEQAILALHSNHLRSSFDFGEMHLGTRRFIPSVWCCN